MPTTSTSTKGQSRRDFIRAGSLASLGLGLGTQGMSAAETDTLTSPSDLLPNKRFTLLITTDLHAQLYTHDEFFWEKDKPVYRKRGGVAVLKTMVETFRKKNPDTILYDGGDYIHGHAIASLTEGASLVPIMNAFAYDLILPGNWEVVYKKKKMLEDMGHATAAKICANMWHKTEGPENGELIYQPYWVKYIAGAKVGFIGYTDHLTPKRQSPAYSEGIRFEHAEYNLARYIKLLKEVEGCGIIFVVTHMGLAQQVGLANNPAIQGADFIIGADTHERVRVPIEGKYCKVVECGAFGSFLGKLDVEVKDGKLQSWNYALLDVDPALYPPDRNVQQLVDKAMEPFRKQLQEVIGYTLTPLVRYFVLETPMDNLITDAVKWKCGPDIALSNGFRFCQPLFADGRNKTAITREFLWNMLPVNSVVKKGWVTGKQIMDWLEKELQNAFANDPAKRFGGWFVRFSGMKVNVTIGNETGKRVNQVSINGAPLDLEKEYCVVACEREGDPEDTLCRIEHVRRPERYEFTLHQVLEEYLKVHSPVAPVQEGRATATDQPSTLLTQLQGTSYTFR